MQKKEPLIFGGYYHIFNKGINGCKLFYQNKNYDYFLNIYEKYIDPIADTYAWCLMSNHFHLLVRIKEEEEIGYYLPLNNENLKNLSEFEKPERFSENKFKTNTFINSEVSDDSFRLKKPNPTNHFSHLFNSYCKSINKQENRTGSLFQHSFKRIKIDNEDYLKQLIIYIHTNPIKHGFAKNSIDYPWSSYHSIINNKPTNISRNQVLDWFENSTNFVKIHEKKTVALLDEKFNLE